MVTIVERIPFGKGSSGGLDLPLETTPLPSDVIIILLTRGSTGASVPVSGLDATWVEVFNSGPSNSGTNGGRVYAYMGVGATVNGSIHVASAGAGTNEQSASGYLLRGIIPVVAAVDDTEGTLSAPLQIAGKGQIVIAWAHTRASGSIPFPDPEISIPSPGWLEPEHQSYILNSTRSWVGYAIPEGLETEYQAIQATVNPANNRMGQIVLGEAEAPPPPPPPEAYEFVEWDGQAFRPLLLKEWDGTSFKTLYYTEKA